MTLTKMTVQTFNKRYSYLIEPVIQTGLELVTDPVAFYDGDAPTGEPINQRLYDSSEKIYRIVDNLKNEQLFSTTNPAKIGKFLRDELQIQIVKEV